MKYIKVKQERLTDQKKMLSGQCLTCSKLNDQCQQLNTIKREVLLYARERLHAFGDEDTVRVRSTHGIFGQLFARESAYALYFGKIHENG